MTKRYEISDLDGSNKRTVTLAEYRAEVEAAKAKVAGAVAAVRRSDLNGYVAAVKAANNTK